MRLFLLAELSPISLLSSRKRDVFVLDHVVNLLLHGDQEQREEVDQKNRPKHGDVKEIDKGADNCNNKCFRGCVPEERENKTGQLARS